MSDKPRINVRYNEELETFYLPRKSLSREKALSVARQILSLDGSPLLADRINEFQSYFRYPDDMHYEPEFWLWFAQHQIDEIEECYGEDDIEHMIEEFADTILVCWKAIQVLSDDPIEKVMEERIDLNLDTKGADKIMEKYTEWWREWSE